MSEAYINAENTPAQNVLPPPRMQSTRPEFHFLLEKPWTQNVNPEIHMDFHKSPWISNDCFRFLWISMNVYGFRECTRPECTTPSQNAIHPPRMQFHEGICIKPWTQIM